MHVQNKYPIYDVSDALSNSVVEYLGSKRKAWLTFNLHGTNKRILFKQGRIGTGENWAEKVTAELAELLKLPHAHYDLAYLGKNKAEQCVITPSFLEEEGDELRLGNEFIEGFDTNHRFKNIKHSLNAIFEALNNNSIQLPITIPEWESSISNASDLFIGYLCFDAWIANTDRHAENWGIITKANKLKILAPTFDHASSLGRNESDEKRNIRLKTKDKGYNVAAYVQRAIMPICSDDGNMLNIQSLVKECQKHFPKTTNYWIRKIDAVMNDEDKIWLILNNIPDEFISEPAKNFAMAMLKENAQLIMNGAT